MEEISTTDKGAESSVAEIKKTKRNFFKFLTWTDLIFLTTVQALTVIFFFYGMASVFGEKISLIRCFYIFGDLFNYNSINAFKLIISALLAILYVIFAVVMIIKLIQTIKFIFMFQSSFWMDSLLSLKENCSFIFLLVFIFIIISNAFYSNQINLMITTTICLTGGALTFHEGVCYYLKTNNLVSSELIYKCVKFLISYAAVSVVFVILNQAVLIDFINGCKIMFKGILFSDIFVFQIILFNNFVMPVLYIIAAIWIFKACDYNLSSFYVNRNDSRVLVKKAWILSVVILTLQFIFNGLVLNKFQEISISILTTWWYSVKSIYLPLFLLLSAWLLVLRFTPKEVSGYFY